jgi:hypothetical protein
MKELEHLKEKLGAKSTEDLLGLNNCPPDDSLKIMLDNFTHEVFQSFIKLESVLGYKTYSTDDIRTIIGNVYKDIEPSMCNTQMCDDYVNDIMSWGLQWKALAEQLLNEKLKKESTSIIPHLSHKYDTIKKINIL